MKILNYTFRFLHIRKTEIQLQIWSKIFLVAIFTMLLSANVSGQSGVIEWKNDTSISNVFQVNADTLLKIYPGVTVTFTNPLAGLRIYGSVEAVGDETEPIIFDASVEQTWDGITITSFELLNSFEYCQFKHIKRNNTKEINSRAVSGIDISMTHNVTFKNCTFIENSDLIGAINSSNLLIDSCDFINNEVENSDKGLLVFEMNTSATISNNYFKSNIANTNGIVRVFDDVNLIIQKNIFMQTSFRDFGASKSYPVIYAQNSIYSNHLAITQNQFIGTNIPVFTNYEIEEIIIEGNDDYISDSTIVYLWKNIFRKRPFHDLNKARKTAVYAWCANLTVAHCEFYKYNQSCINMQYCNAKILLNHFESNTVKQGILYFGSYTNTSFTQSVNNEIKGNYFFNNTCDGIGGVIWNTIVPRINIETLIENNDFIGNIKNSSLPIGGGAAIYDKNYSKLTIHNNLFENNHSYDVGGAIFIENQGLFSSGYVNITSNKFYSNAAGLSGGAIHFENQSLNSNGLSTIANNEFHSNNAILSGGAVFIENHGQSYNGLVNFVNNAFYSNISDLSGGAIFIENYDQSFNGLGNIISNEFYFNEAELSGGAIFIKNHGLSLNEPVNIADNAFYSNKANELRGGAMYIDSTNVLIDGNMIKANEAPEGGGIYAQSLLSSIIQNNSINSNTANDGSGGGICFNGENRLGNSNRIQFIENQIQDNNYSAKGGGIYINHSNNPGDTLIFIRNLIAYNKGVSGSQSNAGGGIFVDSSNTQFYNCNFLNNTASYEQAAIYMNLTADNSFSFTNCNVINHDNEGGINIKGQITPENMLIYNSLFWGNNQNGLGKAILYNALPANKINLYNCYFDLLPLDAAVNYFGTIQTSLPGFTSLNNFYLLCESSVCVDTGNISNIYNDNVNGSGVIYPSCGSERNDIGMSGGPYAQNSIDLFIPPPFALDFDVKVLSHAQKKIHLKESGNLPDISNANIQYRWLFGDGHYSDYQDYKGIIELDYDFDDNIEVTTVSLIIKLGKKLLTGSKTIHFISTESEKDRLSKDFSFKTNDQSNGLSSSCSLNQSLIMYPNPGKGIINISIIEKRYEAIDLSIINPLGQIVNEIKIEPTDNKLSIDLRNQSNGLYFFKFKSPTEVLIKKILIHE